MGKISKAHFQSPLMLTLSKDDIYQADHLTKAKGSLLFSFVRRDTKRPSNVSTGRRRRGESPLKPDRTKRVVSQAVTDTVETGLYWTGSAIP
jgi:hypothetical protein